MIRTSLCLLGHQAGLLGATLAVLQRATPALQRCLAARAAAASDADADGQQLKKPRKKAAAQDVVALTPSGNKSTRMPKAPEPKQPRALSAYVLFVKEQAAGLKGRAPGGVMAVLAPKWKGMSDAEKQPYQEQAAQMAAEIHEARAAAKAAKKALGKPLPSFIQFVQEYRAQHADPALGPKEQMAAAGVAWRALPEQDRALRNTQARLALEAWQAKMQP